MDDAPLHVETGQKEALEASQAYDDLQNVLATSDDGFLFLDQHLHIVRFTQRALALIGVKENMVGQPVSRLNDRFRAADLERDAWKALAETKVLGHAVEVGHGRWVRLCFRPYYATGQIAPTGVIIALTDLSEHKMTEERWKESLRALVKLDVELVERLKAQAGEMRRLGEEVLLAEQRERQRIVQLLHDEFQQLLYALQMRISAVMEGAPLAMHQTAIQDLIQEATALTHTLVVSLAPPIQETDDLVVGLRWLCEYFQDRYGLVVEVESDDTFPIPNEERRLLLFEFIREFLFNVIKHAGVEQAKVSLRREGEAVRIVVEDHGVGLDKPSEVLIPLGREYGLYRVQKQIRLFDGEMTIDSAGGIGTRVAVTIPI